MILECMCVCVCVCVTYFNSSRWVTRVGKKQPLVNEAVILFPVHQAKVKLKGANESIRDNFFGIEDLHFNDMVKHLTGNISKIEGQNLEREIYTEHYVSTT